MFRFELYQIFRSKYFPISLFSVLKSVQLSFVVTNIFNYASFVFDNFLLLLPWGENLIKLSHRSHCLIPLISFLTVGSQKGFKLLIDIQLNLDSLRQSKLWNCDSLSKFREITILMSLLKYSFSRKFSLLLFCRSEKEHYSWFQKNLLVSINPSSPPTQKHHYP